MAAIDTLLARLTWLEKGTPLYSSTILEIRTEMPMAHREVLKRMNVRPVADWELGGTMRDDLEAWKMVVRNGDMNYITPFGVEVAG